MGDKYKFFKHILNTFLICMLLFSSYKIYDKLNEYKQAEKNHTKVLQIAKDTNNKDENLKSINEDYQGWIKIDNTNIDYPILQNKDNDYYLNKDFYKNNSSSGSIFMDYRNDFFNDENVILYGHNMKNKTMFSQLKKFEDKDFFDSNNKIFITKDGREYIYEVFSVYVAQSDFDYLQTSFASNSEFKNYIDTIKSKSIHDSKIDVTTKNKILTLSTCSYEFKNARTVVHARLVDM